MCRRDSSSLIPRERVRVLREPAFSSWPECMFPRRKGPRNLCFWRVSLPDHSVVLSGGFCGRGSDSWVGGASICYVIPQCFEIKDGVRWPTHLKRVKTWIIIFLYMFLEVHYVMVFLLKNVGKQLFNWNDQFLRRKRPLFWLANIPA